MIENKGANFFQNPGQKLYDDIDKLGIEVQKLRDMGIVTQEKTEGDPEQKKDEQPKKDPVWKRWKNSLSEINRSNDNQEKTDKNKSVEATLRESEVGFEDEKKEEQVKKNSKMDRLKKRIWNSVAIGTFSLSFILGIAGNHEDSKTIDPNQDVAANFVPNINTEVSRNDDNDPVISVEAPLDEIEDEVIVISSIDDRLKDFSSRYDFDLMETDEESSDHVDQLANDEYATNFILSRMTSYLEMWQEIQDNGELQVNLAEVVTDMYFRRDQLGNPVLGIYFNPDIVSQAIQNSDSNVVNVSFPIGWMEYNVTLSERRFPELHSYQINGEEVFSENPDLFTQSNEDGSEILVEAVYETINISEMNESDKADFLKQNVDFWSEEEYSFLLNGGYITEGDGVFDDYDSTYANKSDVFLFDINRDGMPRRNQSGDTFSVEKVIEAKVFSAEEAKKIRTEGLVVEFDSPKNRQTGPYQKDAKFPVPEGDYSTKQNIESTYQIAEENPEVSIIVSAGGEDSYWDSEGRPENVYIVSLYERGLSPEGATVYIEPNEEEEIVSSDVASAYLAKIVINKEITDINAYIEENAQPDYVWRDGPNGFSEEEEISVLDI